LRPEDVTLLPPGIVESGMTHANVQSVSWLGAHLRVEIVTEEGYSLAVLLQRSHPMAERVAAGDTVRVAALRGTVLPDPLAAKEPEYFL
jgi:hypothetical protein